MTAKSASRSAARLAAVQALFQHQMEKTAIPKLIKEFHDHRLGKEIEDDQYHPAEGDFFDALVMGVSNGREKIDAMITEKLAADWTLKRIDPTMLQILRAGSHELLEMQNISTAVIIDEYVDVAHAFFDEKDAKFSNGLLDAISKQVRG